MALANSPYAGTNKGAAHQTAKPARGAQLGISTVRRVIGNNVHSGVSLPFGAAPISTHLLHSNGQTVAVHSYMYKGKTQHVVIPVKTSPRRGGYITPLKLTPQTVEGF
jgi:hypothetical protein